MSQPRANMAASVHQRLKNHAKVSGQAFNDLLQHFALERFMYRLSQSRHADRFVLKGALLLRVWRLSSTRTTRDIDLLGLTSNAAEDITAIVQEVCRVEVTDDGLAFDSDSVRTVAITDDAEYAGLRRPRSPPSQPRIPPSKPSGLRSGAVYAMPMPPQRSRRSQQSSRASLVRLPEQ